ncbi:MAG TPA: hypothetical protein VMI93_03135 [Candidatus Solibacter sp.]|nr:hypothetical protein [Candidatus Solibacter sp.]
MLVWQSDGEGQADRWVRRCEWREDAIFSHRGLKLTRRMRWALEYAMAILCALASSYLILRLGL